MLRVAIMSLILETEHSPVIKTLDTADTLKSEKKPSPAQAGLFDLA
jgi:hypothetical protein